MWLPVFLRKNLDYKEPIKKFLTYLGNIIDFINKKSSLVGNLSSSCSYVSIDDSNQLKNIVVTGHCYKLLGFMVCAE